MKIDVLTIFPKMFESPFSESIINRAVDKNLVDIHIHDLRGWSNDKHNSVDDRPYGGGPGMVMRVDVIDHALASLKTSHSTSILMSPKGERYTQQKAQELTKIEHLILLAGHYEEVDWRVYSLVDGIISIGDFVLTGGELPAMTVIDSIVRLIPGVLGDDESSRDESHKTPGYIEYPHYTRPEAYKGMKVPEVLLSGNHAEIEKWRKNNAKNYSDES